MKSKNLDLKLKKINKLTTLFVTAILILSVLTVAAGSLAAAGTETTSNNELTASSDFANGDGSESDPYQISNWTHLNETRNHLGANFTLTADLDDTTEGYSEVASGSANGGKGFDPLSDPNDIRGGLEGTFDGQDYTISDLTIDRPSENNVGLFEWIAPDGNGALRNVTIDNVDITGNDSVGAVAGGHGQAVATIENVSVTGTITGNNTVGGLVGRNLGQIENCSTDVSVYGNSTVGGLVGYNDGRIENSTSDGTVKALEESTGGYFAGLVGKNHQFGTIANSTSTAAVNVTFSFGNDTSVGGLVGYNNKGTVTASNAMGDVTVDLSNIKSFTYGVNIGGFVGINGGPIVNSSAGGNVSVSLYNSTYPNKVGGFAGYSMSSLTASNATGDVEVSANASHSIISGGLIGMGQAIVNQSYSTGDVTASSTNTTADNNIGAVAGGNVGANTNTGTVNASYATGSVSASAADGNSIAGGFAAWNIGSLNNSYAVGAVTGDDEVGGLVGNNSGTVGDSYWDNETTGQSSSAGGTGLTTSQLKANTSLAFDFTNTWDVVDTTEISYPYLLNNTQSPPPGLESLFPGGNGTEASPYQIADWNDLDNVRNALDANFTLVADLDENTTGYESVANDSANNDKGFDPFGDRGASFSGTFDGQDHTIANLTINRTGRDYVALFGRTDGGMIVNVSLEDVEVTGDKQVGSLVGSHGGGVVSASSATGTVDGSTSVGGLVGDSQGRVSHSTAAVSVTGSKQVGGLVGLSSGYSTSQGVVNTSHATGTVDGTSYVGGLVGRNYDGGGVPTVKTSYATGSVNGSDYVGGLIGGNSGETKTSYATGSVNGSDYVGGLIGGNSGETKTSNASGTVTGNDTVGGLVGYNDGRIENSTFDGTVKALEESTGGSFGGLVGENNQFGTIANSTSTAAVNVTFSSGSETKVKVGGLVGHNYKGTVTASNAMGDVNADLSNIDGDGAAVAIGGFVGYAVYGSVTHSSAGGNVSVSLYNSTGGMNLVGGFAGFSQSLLSASNATGDVEVSANASAGIISGGFVGYNLATVNQSYSTGDVTASSTNTTADRGIGAVAGGNVGVNTGTVNASYATGSVSASAADGNSIAGGLAGMNQGSLNNSYAVGAVTGGGEVGGLVGNNSGTVGDSYWDNETTGQSSSAGGTGLTTSEMKGSDATDNMNLDFTDTWGVVSGNKISYPYLQNNHQQPEPGLMTLGPDPIKNEDTGETFSTIQAAIDDTNTDDGDTIIVNSGTYVENVVVDKEITLKGNNTGDGAPVIDGNQVLDTVEITADDVEITGFKITNSSSSENNAGVFIDSDNSTIHNNTLINNNYGLNVGNSRNTTITNNHISDNSEFGLHIQYSENITIQKNTMQNNGQVGVSLFSSRNISILSNEIGNGLLLSLKTSDLDVEDNTVNGDPLIYHENQENKEISDVNAGQIVLNNCTDFTIKNQKITNTGAGIELFQTDQTTITETDLKSNLAGLYLLHSDNNTIKKSNISQNDQFGVYLYISNDNVFFLNDFNNSQNVYSESSDNTWVSPEPKTYTYEGETYTSRVGNYWSDYDGTDSDNDGLYDGNKTIQMENNNDTRPLVNPTDHYTNIIDEFAGGNGSEESPYQIENWYHLNNTRNHLDANFILINNLDKNTEGYDEVASSTANGGKGFMPIGDTNDFGGLKGTFDGQGYTISDLTIDRPSEDYIGLFEWVAPYGDGAVRNLTIDNVDITGNDYVGAVAGGHGEAYATIENVSVGGTITGNQYVGGLVGLNQGQIENCSTDVSVYGNRSVGGFVGYNGGAIIYSTASGTVTVKDGATDPMNFGGLVGKNYRGAVGYSSATGDVDADSATNVGGLIGYNEDVQYKTILETYATGAVNGGVNVGGLIGNNINDLVDNSYATGNVNGSSNVGGLIGNNTGSNALVNNSYAVGEITATGDKVGGLVGVNESGATVKNSYWNTETTGQDTSAGNAEGLTTAEMKNKSTFAGWDFEKIWNIMEPDSGFYSYPYLQNNKQDQVPGKEAVSLESVEITPSADQTITAGETIDFNATAYDQYDNQVDADDTNFTWQNTDDTGLFDKTTAGQYDVKATMDSIDSAVITVTVEPADVDTVEITPSADQTITAGETIDFNATAYDQYDNQVDADDTNFTWQNTSNTGLFDNTTAGQYDVKATMDSIDSTVITVTVEPADVNTVEITPSTDQTITAGETIDFNATAYDQYDNQVDADDTNFTWQNTDDTGLFDKTTAGEYEVKATMDSVDSATLTLTVEPANVNTVEITPSSDHTITAGETIDFNATAYDQYDNQVDADDTNFTWQNTSNMGLFDNTTTGQYDVKATMNNVDSTVITVTVEPASVNTVEITPSSDQTITAGETIDFNATAYDQYDNPIDTDDANFTWKNADNTGLFDKTTAGQYDIKATIGSVESNMTTVIVNPADVDTVEISPSSDQTITAGETIDFNATAYDQYNNMISDTDSDFTWQNTDDTGLFDKTTAGQYDVKATMDSVDSAVITVTVEPGSVNTVEIIPSADQTITAGETIDFNATAYDQYDNQVDADDTNFTWQNTDDTGLFDNTTAGQYDVKATMDSIDSTVITVTVEPADVNTVEISPSTDQTIKAGETIDFNATAYDQYDNQVDADDTNFTWQNTDDTGLFDKTTAGEYEVKATMDNVDSTVITVTVEPTEYDLTINIAGEGSTSPAEGSHTYEEGNEVTITATPAEGWYFSNWTGDYDGTSEEISITMDSDKEITANFEEEVSFQVDITDYDQKVVEGEEVTVEYTVENNGEIESTQDIVLMIDGENTTVKEDLTLAPGESSTEEYTWIPDDPGEYSVGLPGDDPDDLVQVTVDTEYQVDLTDLDESVEEGEEVTVEYTVENPGETESTQDIVLLINGEEVIVEEGVTLKPGETYSGQYTWTPENVGDIEVGVPGDDSGDFNQVTVEKGSQSDNLWIVILLLVSGFAAMLWLNKDKLRPTGSADEKEDLTELQKKESESEEEELTEE